MNAIHETEENKHFDVEDSCFFIRNNISNINKTARPKNERKHSNTNYKTREMLINEVQEIKEQLERIQTNTTNFNKKQKN